MGDEWLDLYISHLKAYTKTKNRIPTWDEYAQRNLDGDERREFARIINELLDHGFYGPHVESGRLVCYTLVKGKSHKR